MNEARDALGLIAWTRNPGRLMDIGRVFHTQPKIISFSRLRSRWSAPFRYGLSIILTATWLLRARPQVVIVCSPPPFASALVAIYSRLSNAVFILDAHPGAFGHRDRLWKLFVPLQRALVSRALVTMVTEPALGDAVHKWGGRSLVFHEAPPEMAPTRPRKTVDAKATIVFTTIFDPDEPLSAITEAACDLAECDVILTGDASRLANDLRHKLLTASHVRLTGWLEQSHYLNVIRNADVVVALTRDPHSVMRSAFEAVYLERPTVLSDTTTMRKYFSPSVFVRSTGDAVVEGVRSVLSDYGAWVEQTCTRHDALMQRWTTQQAALKSVIGAAMNGSHNRVGVTIAR